MKHSLYIILIALGLCSAAVVQFVSDDRELAALVDIVKMLRESNETNFRKATDILTSDMKWTPMDETGAVRDGVECKASENVPRFKLNRILSRVDGSRKYVSTHGDMVNGEDARYDYSLYERALKPKAKVEYALKGREGRQTFIVVPYNTTAKLDVSIVINGKKIVGQSDADGTVVVNVDKNLPVKTDKLNLSVTNRTNAPQAFVIINHNTRKK